MNRQHTPLPRELERVHRAELATCLVGFAAYFLWRSGAAPQAPLAHFEPLPTAWLLSGIGQGQAFGRSAPRGPELSWARGGGVYPCGFAGVLEAHAEEFDPLQAARSAGRRPACLSDLPGEGGTPSERTEPAWTCLAALALRSRAVLRAARADRWTHPGLAVLAAALAGLAPLDGDGLADAVRDSDVGRAAPRPRPARLPGSDSIPAHADPKRAPPGRTPRRPEDPQALDSRAAGGLSPATWRGLAERALDVAEGLHVGLPLEVEIGALWLVAGGLDRAREAFARVDGQGAGFYVQRRARIGLSSWARELGERRWAAELAAGAALAARVPLGLRLQAAALCLEAGAREASGALLQRLDLPWSTRTQAAGGSWVRELGRRIHPEGCLVHPRLRGLAQTFLTRRTPAGALCRVLLAG